MLSALVGALIYICVIVFIAWGMARWSAHTRRRTKQELREAQVRSRERQMAPSGQVPRATANRR